MHAWVLNTPLLFEDSLSVFFSQTILHYKTLEICLTLSRGRPLSYRNQSRNQSIDLPCKSMDWFLHDTGLRHERVKVKNSFKVLYCTFFNSSNMLLNS